MNEQILKSHFVTRGGFRIIRILSEGEGLVGVGGVGWGCYQYVIIPVQDISK